MLLLVVAGCGGGSGGGRLSKHEFIKRGDAICRKYNRQANKIAQSLGNSLRDIADAINKVIPIARKEWTELKTLKPPAEDQTTFDAWIAAGLKQIDEGKKLHDAAVRRDFAGFQAHFATIRASQNDLHRRARGMGLRVCGT